jgi:hypothetical protein
MGVKTEKIKVDADTAEIILACPSVNRVSIDVAKDHVGFSAYGKSLSGMQKDIKLAEVFQELKKKFEPKSTSCYDETIRHFEHGPCRYSIFYRK